MPIATQMIIDYIQGIEPEQNRLVLIVGKPGSGKSKVMRELSGNRGWRYINCRELITDDLLELVPKERPHEAPRIISSVLTRLQASVYLLDSVQVFFTPMLQLEPLELLRGLGKKHAIVAAWPGSYENGQLTYLELGQEEPRRFEATGIKVIEL